jgi:hypothetical protein
MIIEKKSAMAKGYSEKAEGSILADADFVVR